MAKKGLFVVFEGIDGSGKGTMLSLVAEHLFSNYKQFDSIFLTREPSNSKHGQQIRKILSQSSAPKTDGKKLLSLYVRDRKEHLSSIKPLLKEGAIVLCDRYKYSTIAYQQAQGINPKKIIKMHSSMLIPDLVLILDISPEEALQRISLSRTATEKFEKPEFLHELRKNYFNLKKQLPKENIVLIDASLPKEEVFQQILIPLKPLLKQ